MSRTKYTDSQLKEIALYYHSQRISRKDLLRAFDIPSVSQLYNLVSKARDTGVISEQEIDEQKKEVLSSKVKTGKNKKTKKRKNQKKELAEQDLRRIGDTALEEGYHAIRTTLLKYLGETESPKFKSYVNNEAVKQIVEDLHELDAEYQCLGFEPVQITRSGRKIFSDEEETIFHEVLSDLIDKGYTSDNFPKGEKRKKVVGQLKEALIKAGFITKRRNDVIRNHAKEIWEDKVEPHLPTRVVNQRKKPTSGRITKYDDLEDQVQEVLVDTDKKLQREVEKFPALREVLENIVEPDPDAEKRTRDLKFMGGLEHAGKWHQRLMAYLIDPNNYQRIFGPEFTLLHADFTLENTQEEIYEQHKDLVERLHMSEVDEAVARFVDDKIRLDLLFKLNNRVYSVAEVKQYATNKIRASGKPGDQNADRAGQQLFRYKGALLYNILKVNRSLPEAQRIPEKVLGYIVAYEIGEELQSIVQSQGDRIAVIDKEKVDSYLEMPSSRVVEDSHITKDLPQEQYEQRLENFQGFQTIVEGGKEKGVYDPKKQVVEIAGVLYNVGNSIPTKRFISQAVRAGRLIRGHANVMKHNEAGVEI